MIPYYMIDMKDIIYTGIGSRSTPKEILELFYELGRFFASSNFILRSGAADGADRAFELGCDYVKGKKEIYLPWRNFNGSDSNLILKDKDINIGRQYHWGFDKLSFGAKKLMSRNSYQVMGYTLNINTNFIICYTENGSGKGGTGQAIRIARSMGIPVFDVGKYKSVELFLNDLFSYIDILRNSDILYK